MEDQLPPRPGKCKCLRCDKVFDSADVVRWRICDKCTDKLKSVRAPRIFASCIYAGNRRIDLHNEE